MTLTPKSNPQNISAVLVALVSKYEKGTVYTYLTGRLPIKKFHGTQ